MPGRRTEAADNLLLVAATAIFVLTAQRYLETITAPEPAPEPANALPDSFETELSQRGRGRLSSNPFQIPFAGWKDSCDGDLHANGTDAVDFYTRKKVLTSRW